MGLVQIRVTFCEHFVFQECKQILYITLAKYLGQSIAGLFLSRSLSFQVLNESHDMTVHGIADMFFIVPWC